MSTIKIVIGLFITCAAAWAQGSTSQINGTVRDSTALAVPGATVKVTQTATGGVRTVTSGADGAFVLPNLPIGPYLLEVTKDGFSKYAQSGIVLQVDSNPTIDTSGTIEMPASLRSENRSPSARNAVRVPFGMSVRLRRNPHPSVRGGIRCHYPWFRWRGRAIYGLVGCG